ncbi:MAG TPA: trimeric intracellular cation channel family protein [Flavipsychrobacter sp.]|nr:trimeric intracellular cation channel family protein [Flavipsychrobacter sp.]
MSIQYLFELLGTSFFAISGALIANENSKPDWFGVTFIGFVTAIGGGSLRDMLLGSYPLVWVSDVSFVYAIIAGIVLSSLFYTRLLRLRRTLFLFDTFGIALFTILGAEKAMNYGLHPLVASIMGMFSAVMGGVIRDVLTNRVPVLFHKEIYATACLAGAFLYVVLAYQGVERDLNFIISGAVIVLIRIFAVTYKLSLPKFRDDGN